MRFYLILAVSVISFVAHSTVFRPLSIKKHLQESSGVIQGEVTSISSELDENNKIVTRVNIKAEKWIGDYYIENEEVSVFYPGGQVGSQGRFIDGSPKFSLGENVVLLTKSADDYQWVSNLGLGKYSVKRIGEEKIIVNQIFPTEPKMGQIKLNDFYEIAKEIKGSKFQYRFKEKYEVYHKPEMENPIAQKTFGRKIASVESLNQKSSSIDPYWLVILLAVLGIGIGVLRIRKS